MRTRLSGPSHRLVDPVRLDDRVKRTYVLDDYQGVALTSADWSTLNGSIEVTVGRKHLDEFEELVRELEPFEVVVAMRERTALTAAVLERLPNLELIVTTGAANAAIDVPAARARGVEVCGTRGYVPPTMEQTWALILACVKQTPSQDRALRAGAWQTKIGGDLHGRQLGVIGLGRLGGQVAAVAHAFGMKVSAWSSNLTDERCNQLGVTRSSLDTLLRTSDVVTLHLVLSERTRRLLGPAEFATMKPSAYLINTSRGELLDEPALVAALESGTIAGAGLDVFTQEPLPSSSPLRQMENVVLSPHMGYVTESTYRIYFEDVVAAIDAHLHGQVLRPVP